LAQHEGWPIPAQFSQQVGNTAYVVVQILPWDAVREHAQHVIETLGLIEERWGLRIVLLPITDYCQDYQMMSWLNRASGGRFVLLDPGLTYEERGRVLLGSNAFLGQSLHGLITALASGAPAGAVMSQTGDQKFIETLEDLKLAHLRIEAWSEFGELAQRVLEQKKELMVATSLDAVAALSDYLDDLAKQIRLGDGGRPSPGRG
jgi:hypothetical protein